MPYNEATVLRIRNVLYDKGISFSETKMFGGICFMVDHKMCCGTRIDNKTNEEVLLCRIGEEMVNLALEQNKGIPMEVGKKIMKDYIFVTQENHQTNKDLTQWLQHCLEFNPLAKKSKK